MEESNTCESVPDLKDLELKVGRKTPEGLLRWMREEHKMISHHQTDNNETEKKGLDEKIRKLKTEMVRASSTSLYCQIYYWLVNCNNLNHIYTHIYYVLVL